MSDDYSQFDGVHKSFDDGSIDSCDNETLKKHLISLSNEPVPNEAVQHRNIIRGITINHILMQRHIDGLNKQNLRTQKFVIALTVAALLVGIPQIWYAYRADNRAEIEQKTNLTQQQLQAPQSATPSKMLPPSSGQSTPKKSATK